MEAVTQSEVTCNSCGALVVPVGGSWCPACSNAVTGPGGAPTAPPVPRTPGVSADPAPGDRAVRSCETSGCNGAPLLGARYCPVCELERAPTERSFVVTGAWGALPVPAGASIVLGRDPDAAPDAALLLADAHLVSRQHARLDNGSGVLTITDLRSSNGTTVNRRRIAPGESVTLLPGDVVSLGTQVDFEVTDRPPQPARAE